MTYLENNVTVEVHQRLSGAASTPKGMSACVMWECACELRWNE